MWRYDWAWALLSVGLLVYQVRGNRRLVIDLEEIADAGYRRMRLARAVLPSVAAWAAINALVRLGVRLDLRKELLANEWTWAAIQMLVLCTAFVAVSRTGRPRWMIHPSMRDLQRGPE